MFSEKIPKLCRIKIVKCMYICIPFLRKYRVKYNIRRLNRLKYQCNNRTVILGLILEVIEGICGSNLELTDIIQHDLQGLNQTKINFCYCSLLIINNLYIIHTFKLID